MTDDPRIAAVPDIHGHAKGEHKLYVDERPIPYTARMLFLWFFHACRRGAPRFLMVADHINYLTFEDPAAVNLVRRALKLAQAGDLYGAAETAGVEVGHAAVVGEGLRRGMRYSIGAEVDNDPRSRPDAQNIVDAMRPDGIVRSVHFLQITHPQHGEWMWPFDNPEFRDVYDIVGTERTWELYMAALLEAIEKLPGHIVGHFYVPAKFGHWPADDVLEGYEDRLLDACAERGMAVEINARFFYKHAAGDDAQLEKYRAAHLRLLRKAKEKGVAVAVGSDAHSPKDQGRAFSDVLALLDQAEINEIAFPIDGRMARVALRATDESRKARAANGTVADRSDAAIVGTEERETPEPAPALASEPPVVAPDTAAAPPLAKKRPSRAKKAPAPIAGEPAEAAGIVESPGPEPEPEPAPAPEPSVVASSDTVASEPAWADGTLAEATLPSEEPSLATPESEPTPKSEPVPESEPTPVDAPRASESPAHPPVAVAVAATAALAMAAVAAVATELPKRVRVAKPAATPKRAAKPVAKTSLRSAAAAKASPAATKKRVTAKTAAKKAKPTRAAAPAKKAAAKKTARASKPASKAVAKTASRTSAKKTSAKKIAKKKKHRR